MIQPIILSRLNSINHYFIITNTGSVIWNGSTVEWLRLGGGGGGGGGGGLSVVEFGWIRNIPTQKSEQPLLELARDEVFFPPQDTILLLNTCQKDLIREARFLHAYHMYNHICTKIVMRNYWHRLCHGSAQGLPGTTLKPSQQSWNFRKHTPQPGCCKGKILHTAPQNYKKTSCRTKITRTVSGNVPQELPNSSRLGLQCVISKFLEQARLGN